MQQMPKLVHVNMYYRFLSGSFGGPDICVCEPLLLSEITNGCGVSLVTRPAERSGGVPES